MGIGINIAGTGIGLTQTIMNQKNKQTGPVSYTHLRAHENDQNLV